MGRGTTSGGTAGAPMRGVAAALLAALALPATSDAARVPVEVVVVTQRDIGAYQEVIDEFRDRFRGRWRVVDVEHEVLQLSDGSLVLAVGQRALDAVAPLGAMVVSALARHVPPGVMVADAAPAPELALGALKAARPSVRRVGVVFGPRTEALIEPLEQPARALGVELVRVRAGDGPEAVRELSRVAARIDALWLAPDLDVMVPQLFQYALRLQIQDALPVAAVTRQQVKSGALLSVDAAPRTVGRDAAAIINELLEGQKPAALLDGARANALELSVNPEVARRLHADLDALRRMGARSE